MSVSDRWSAQRGALAVDILRGGGRLRLQVHGESMLPTLWPGDLVEIEACSLGDVRVGEIVFARREGRFFLHRLLTRNARTSFISRGDSMPGPDPEFPVDSFLGKLTSVTRAGQSVSSAVRPWSRAIGVLFCYCGFARRVALRLRLSNDSRGLTSSDLEIA